MGLPVDLHPEAAEEIRAAIVWYAARSPKASESFLRELDKGIELISENPETWPQFMHGTRRYLLRRFPYSIVYRVTPATIHVVAVAHARRRPGYWRMR